MNLHANSLLSYDAGTTNGEFSARQQAVLSVFRLRSGARLTDREVLKALELTDMNAVRPRITELVAARVLVEDGQAMDEATHRTVRLVRLAEKQSNFLF